MNAFSRILEWSKQAAREHWLPLLILFVPVNWVVYQSDADNVLPLLPLPIVAFVVGLMLRPHHVWLGSIVMVWIVVGYMGNYSDPGPDETVASIMIEAFIWMAFGILIPAWFGRLIRADSEEHQHHRRAPGES